MEYPKTHEEVEALKKSYLRDKGLKRISKMHKLWGENPFQCCGECKYLFKTNWDQATQYFKCELYGVTGGPGTDWRKKWIACGKWEAR